MISDERWPPAASLGEALERLRDHGVIAAPVAVTMVRAVGLRHVIAHGYGGVRPEMIHAAATTGLPDLESFARDVAAWLGGRA